VAWIPLASVAGVVALAIWNSYHKSLWIDEAYSLNTANQSLRGTWHQALHFELQPPLYYMLLNVWIHLGSPTVQWMRVLSALCAVGCVLFFWATRPHAMPRPGGVPAPILAVVTGTVAWAAAEARPYALALFFSAWTMYFFVRILDRQDNRSWLDAVLYVIGAYAGILTFYYVGFLLAGQWVAAATIQRGRRWLTFSLVAVAVGLVPWIPVVQDQLTKNVNPSPAVVLNPAMRYLAGGPATNPPSAFLAGVFGDAPVLTQTAFGTVVIGLLLLVVVGLRFAMPDRGGAPPATASTTPAASGAPLSGDAATGFGWLEAALGISLVVPAVCLLGLQASNVISVYPRHLVCLTPPFILLWALWTGRIAPGIGRWIGGTALLTAAVLTLVSYERHVDVADSRRAAAYVVAHGATNEPVLVVGPEAVLPFRYYYNGLEHGRAPVFGIPIDAPLDVYDPTQFDLRDTSQIGARMRAAGVNKQFWMVVSQGFVWRIGPADSLVTGYLQTHATVLDSVSFTNVYVIHAVKR